MVCADKTVPADSSVPYLPESMVDLLTGLLHPNHKKRLTAEDALNRFQASDETLRKTVHWQNCELRVAG